MERGGGSEQGRTQGAREVARIVADLVMILRRRSTLRRHMMSDGAGVACRGGRPAATGGLTGSADSARVRPPVCILVWVHILRHAVPDSTMGAHGPPRRLSSSFAGSSSRCSAAIPSSRAAWRARAPPNAPNGSPGSASCRAEREDGDGATSWTEYKGFVTSLNMSRGREDGECVPHSPGAPATRRAQPPPRPPPPRPPPRLPASRSFSGPPNAAELLAFKDSAKWKLAVVAVASETGMTEEAVREALGRLRALLPGLEQARIERMRPGDVARLATGVDELAVRLVGIKAVLPRTDVGSAASRWPDLLSLEPADVAWRLASLRETLPGLRDPDKLVERCPWVLDTDFLLRSVRSLLRLYQHQTLDALVPAIEASPELLFLAEDNRKLSIW